MPLTPDYNGPLLCYADGVFDSRFNRYLTVREGSLLIYLSFLIYLTEICFYIFFSLTQFSFMNFIAFLLDRRESSINATTTIVSIDLCGNHIKGKNYVCACACVIIFLE